MTEVKQITESPQAKPAQTVSTGEPAQSPVERVTEKKAKDPKRWRRACRRCRPNTKYDCSNSFRKPRNLYVRATRRKQTQKTENAQTNGSVNKVTRPLPRGSLGLVLRVVRLRLHAFRARMQRKSVPFVLGAPLNPRPKSRISPPIEGLPRPPLYGISHDNPGYRR